MYRKQGTLPPHAQVTTDVRSQLPELGWELEHRTGSAKAEDGTGLLHLRLGEEGRSSC